MPNLVLEYTNSVDERVNIQGLLEDLHQVAIDSDLFQAIDVKSRALRCHHWLIGELSDSEDFIHITFELLDGRTQEQKQQLSANLMAVLTEQASGVKSLSVNMRDMDRSTFQKVVL
ncbi:5-carboxymethyl-2-hydroxymuconate isomerase [Vibrio sp. MACH09]|uniref:5-carboxymethyl-2-hydroxymuconate Delta-isomerase n=1 Tax=Vibrio sp. MACH09 TaxID=3025122 RepID=UPI0027927170|nr:5-carboxymethyl-2-hydroxymuconate Delta-isomerase [Vibrio sp. MACH09]GLO62167.1 5-carboxymethyl-2-hydroxymuconate isomerase [Vibrio sp. MACH09]